MTKKPSIARPTYLSLVEDGFDPRRGRNFLEPSSNYDFDELFDTPPARWEAFTIREQTDYVRRALVMYESLPTWIGVDTKTLQHIGEFFEEIGELNGNCGIEVIYNARAGRVELEALGAEYKPELADSEVNTPVLLMTDMDAARVLLRYELEQEENGQSTGIRLFSFNEEQNRYLGDVPKVCGYSLLLSANNPNTGHNIYLYGKTIHPRRIAKKTTRK